MEEQELQEKRALAGWKLAIRGVYVRTAEVIKNDPIDWTLLPDALLNAPGKTVSPASVERESTK